jgi:hypothetical protein
MRSPPPGLPPRAPRVRSPLINTLTLPPRTKPTPLAHYGSGVAPPGTDGDQSHHLRLLPRSYPFPHPTTLPPSNQWSGVGLCWPGTPTPLTPSLW